METSQAESLGFKLILVAKHALDQRINQNVEADAEVIALTLKLHERNKVQKNNVM